MNGREQVQKLHPDERHYSMTLSARAIRWGRAPGPFALITSSSRRRRCGDALRPASHSGRRLYW